MRRTLEQDLAVICVVLFITLITYLIVYAWLEARDRPKAYRARALRKQRRERQVRQRQRLERSRR